MARDGAETVSLGGFADALEQGCREGRTGTFYLVTDRNHTATVTLRAGRVVGLRYRIARHLAALAELLKVQALTYRFEANVPTEPGAPELPDDGAILAQLRAASAPELQGAATPAPAPRPVHMPLHTRLLAPEPAAPPSPGGLSDGAKRALEAALVEQIGPMAHVFARQVFADAGSAADASRRLAAYIPDPARAVRFSNEVRRRLGVA